MNGKQHIIYLFLINEDNIKDGRTETAPYIPIPMKIFTSSFRVPVYPNDKMITTLYMIYPIITDK